MADLTIVVTVRGNQTMSLYKVPKNGKVTFVNASTDGDLVVTPKGSGSMPFCEDDKVTAWPGIVPKNDEDTVRICNAFEGDELLYTAQVGTALPEDPIIIFEKSNVALNLASAIVIGFVVGAALTVIIVKLWTRKTPTQG